MKVSRVVIAVLCLAAFARAGLVENMIAGLKKYDTNLKADQESNAKAIMTGCVEYTTSVNQLSYILSTAIGESSLRPIKEIRAKEGTNLFEVQNKYWYTGYYGRGYVQLTWDYNYKKFGQLLGVDLLGNPDLAMRPDIAGKIICMGMKKGLFTGVGLDKYFTSSSNDWTNARRIINGVDKAEIFGKRGLDIANLVPK